MDPTALVASLLMDDDLYALANRIITVLHPSADQNVPLIRNVAEIGLVKISGALIHVSELARAIMPFVELSNTIQHALALLDTLEIHLYIVVWKKVSTNHIISLYTFSLFHTVRDYQAFRNI